MLVGLFARQVARGVNRDRLLLTLILPGHRSRLQQKKGKRGSIGKNHPNTFG